MSDKPDISLFFPVYNDEATVRTVASKALALLADIADQYEVIIVDDGSPDRAGEIADQLAREDCHVVVVHHPRNLGYGAAVRSGFAKARYEWICLTDGDDEYDVEDFRRLMELRNFYDLIITFRYVKVYSSTRQFISWIYNGTLRALFRTRFRDISTGLRVVRKTVTDKLDLSSDSPFIGAELTVKCMLKGYRIGEVGIQTFPRVFGHGSSTSTKNILATMADMARVYQTIFSTSYDLPPGRGRRAR